MNNRMPNNSKYNSGLYVPTNKDKVLKLNPNGGVIYRSSWEKIIMVWLDNNTNIKLWGSECLEIPYELTHFESGLPYVKKHRYYPDFYYQMALPDGTLKHVVVEVKPMKEFKMVQDLNEGRLTLPEKGTGKKLKNFEYDLKMAQKNRSKWETMIKFCNKKGWFFIVITEEHIKKMK